MKNIITLFLVKTTYLIIKILRLGAGYTWSGELALRFNSQILKNEAIYPKKGFILISGTNGKTTTSKLISHILVKNGLRVVNNKSGANLLNGIVATLCLSCNFIGKNNNDWGVIEVDEMVLPEVLKTIHPRILVLLNLSRDQLDRYGETDLILEKWEESLAALPTDVTVVFDSTQTKFSAFSTILNGAFYTFDGAASYLTSTSLFGDFNAKNVNAALKVCALLNISIRDAVAALKDFSPAWGRGEIISYADKEIRVLLAKNPMSFNSNLNLLTQSDFDFDTLLFILNDNIPDGRDVSWIYDIDREKLKDTAVSKKIYISGTRAYDFAVRCIYAGINVDKQNVYDSVKSCVAAISKDTDAKSIVALPNYSAMLDLRKIIIGRRIL